MAWEGTYGSLLLFEPKRGCVPGKGVTVEERGGRPPV
jgi:hypothetical protein